MSDAILDLGIYLPVVFIPLPPPKSTTPPFAFPYTQHTRGIYMSRSIRGKEHNVPLLFKIGMIDSGNPLLQTDLFFPSKIVYLAYIQQFLWCTIGFGGIPYHLSFKSHN